MGLAEQNIYLTCTYISNVLCHAGYVVIVIAWRSECAAIIVAMRL